MLDYEHAAGASVSDHFPSASIHGCWFHYNQAVFRKWKSLHLSNAPLDVLFMTMTLPLAPPEYFVEGYKIIEEQADSMREYPDIHLFLAYLRRNWLSAASKVSVYKCPARTNNIVESFHNMATKKFGTKHPNLWIFLEKMTNLIMDQELDLGRAKRGLRVRRICSRLQRQKNLRITEVQEDLITGKISLQQFLKMFNNEHQQYSMQKLTNEDSNNNNDINLEHFAELQKDETENEDIPYYPVQPVSDVRTSDCCSICLVNKADHTFIPCGHLCCCSDCILELQSKRCPICNVDYNSYLKVIIP
ncbi:hypothetical protein CAJAP_10242 [Camponotus japonicus]